MIVMPDRRTHTIERATFSRRAADFDFGDRATVPAALLDSVVAGSPMIPVGEARELVGVEGMRAFVQAVAAQQQGRSA